MSAKKLTVGITGGIGSGKSVVANYFAQLGVNVLEADQVTRELVSPNKPAYLKIITKFGTSILLEDGYINRRLLAELIFNDAALRKWLEKLLHPLVREKMADFVAAATSPYCILVIPLLIENLPNTLVDRILVVDSSEETQILRTEQRDHLSRSQILAIISTQTSRLNRLAYADDVIQNNGNKEELYKQVTKLHTFYLDLSRDYPLI